MIMNCYVKGNKGFLTLLGLVFALAIICWFAYFALNVYFKQPSSEINIDNALPASGVSTFYRQTIVDTTRKKIENITEQHIKELNDVKKQLGQ